MSVDFAAMIHRHRRLLWLLLSIATIAGCRSVPPAAPQVDLSDTAAILRAAREVMAAAQFCALITLDEEGRPQARVMDPTAPDARMVVTLMTNPASRKVAQIERDPRVTLFYFDRGSPGYVTILGRAKPILDSAEKRRRWVERWNPHRDGPDDALLYEVVPDRIEVVSIAHSVVGDDDAWTPPSIELP